MDIKKTVIDTIKKHRLIKKGDRVLVGLSGGADSTALLRVLYSLKDELEITLACAHINHKLRETADRDMNFCKELCGALGVEFFCLTADIRGGAQKCGMSEELYARKVRYDYFNSLGFDKIATAHNKNDVAETILFNFMRGSSPRGLAGIPYRRDNVIRPLLDVKKCDIVDFCKSGQYEFVTDETNLEAVYTRNKIRLKLIPEIEADFNPNFTEVVTKNAELFREDSDFLEELAKKEYDGEICAEKVNRLPNPIKRRVIQLHWKRAADATDNLAIGYIDSLAEILEKNYTGKAISLPNGFTAKMVYGRLVISKNTKKIDYEYKIFPEKLLNIPEIGKAVIIRKCSENAEFYLSDGDSLTVRRRRSGDVFYPKGMSGKKKLSDYFTDKKIPSDMRDFVPILLKGDAIVSVGNMRADRRFSKKVGDGFRLEIKEI